MNSALAEKLSKMPQNSGRVVDETLAAPVFGVYRRKPYVFVFGWQV